MNIENANQLSEANHFKWKQENISGSLNFWIFPDVLNYIFLLETLEGNLVF